MFRKFLAAGVLAAAGILAGAASARADGDVMLLKMSGKVEAPATTLAWDGKEADTIDVAHGFHGGFHHGGFHHGGFHYGGFHHGGFHHFHHGFGGFYRGFGYGFGFYPRYYYPGYYYPYYYNPGIYFSLGLYRPYYYYTSPAFYYGYPTYPISASLTTMPYAVSLSVGQSAPALQTAPAAPLMPAAPADGTFPYDGGPASPVPLPRAEPAPTGAPATVPLEGRVVSLPAKPAKLTYPAYGEGMARPGSLVKDRVVKSEADEKSAR